MQTRKVRRLVCGKWNDIKWSDINRGDVIRVYDREYNHHDGETNTFCAVDSAILVSGVWSFKYARIDAGLRKPDGKSADGQISNPDIFVMTNTSKFNVHDNVRAGTQRRWRNLKKRPKGSKKAK